MPEDNIRGQQGFVVVLALVVLLILTGLALALLSMGALEPQISANLVDLIRARYLAEAGIERGFEILASTGDDRASWSALLEGGAGTAPGWTTLLSMAPLPGRSPAAGTHTILIRNDGAGDTALVAPRVADTGPTLDENLAVILRSLGAYRRARRGIEVVVARIPLPALAGALNILGRLEGLRVEPYAFDIDGRDVSCASACERAENWATSPSGPLALGIAVAEGGPISSEALGHLFGVSASCDTPCADSRRASVRGRSIRDGAPASGADTVATDPSMTRQAVTRFVAQVGALGGAPTAVIEAGCATPVLSGNDGADLPVLDACGSLRRLDAGRRGDPRVIHLRGPDDQTTGAPTLAIPAGTAIRGAGILVLENVNLYSRGSLDWEGLVILSGRGGISLLAGSRTAVRGALVVIDDPTFEAPSGSLSVDPDAASFAIWASRQGLGLAARARGLISVTHWREF